jgi:tetratricopeptide (TPR) repeat protein
MLVIALENDDELSQTDALVELEVFLSLDSEVQTYILNRLCAYELPDSINQQSSELPISDLPHVTEMLSQVFGAQGRILRLRSKFDALPDELFQSHYHRIEFLSSAVRSGVFRRLATSPASDMRSAIFESYQALAHQQNSREITRQWLSEFVPPRTAVHNSLSGDADASEGRHDSIEVAPAVRAQASRQAFRNVLAQQEAISLRLQAGDLVTAQKFARQLVQAQLANSDPGLAAKTLCSLAQKAKELEYYSLQFEWTHWATELCPHDAIAESQLADALIQLSRFEEAETALCEAERLGEGLYAANGRARILREQGRLAEAVPAFRAATRTFSDDPNVYHAIVGAAKSLREMGQLEEAYEEYSAGLRRFPEEISLYLGRGAVLTDMGRFEEAISDFTTATRLNANDASALVGMASLYRESGKIAEAEELFRLTTKLYPNNIVAAAGLIETLRVAGQLCDANELAQRAVRKFGQSSTPRMFQARVQEDLGDFRAAKESYLATLNQARIEEYAHYYLAALYQRLGELHRAEDILQRARDRFPDNLHIRRASGDILVRLGDYVGAQRQLAPLLAKYPRHQRIRNSNAILEISLGNLGRALELTKIDSHASQSDWRALAIEVQILLRSGQDELATSKLLRAIQAVPFAKESRLLRNLLASIHLGKQKYSAALSVVEEWPGELGAILKLHAYAVGSDKGSAIDYYNLVRDSLSDEHGILADEIVVVYNIREGIPNHHEQWIFKSERDGLLMEAA